MAGQRDAEGRRRSGVWLSDECWDWLAANTAPGMTRSDLIEGLVLLAMDEQKDTQGERLCGRCKQLVKGHAQIDETWYCHDDSQRPSCYELASSDLTFSRLREGLAGLSRLAETLIPGAVVEGGPS